MALEKFTGLTEEEVIKSRNQFGSNTIEEKTRYKFLGILREIVIEPLFVILICAALIYFLLGDINEGIIMLFAIVFVSGISIFQENRSRTAIDSLKKLSSPVARVIRNAQTIDIASGDIVMNDLILVEDGYMIPADAQVEEAHDFSVNESLLTGESLAVFKNITERDNKIYNGTMVVTGSCIARVTAIGKQTRLGKIGESLQEIEQVKTPLQIQIKAFVKSMVGVGVIAFFIIWGVNYYLTKNVLHGLLHGLTIAMSVLPEEIPVAFSTFMALGAYHLYKKKVIVRSPYTVETLGAATVICADKTGTLTENDMKLAAIYECSEKKLYHYNREDYQPNQVLEFAMWASETNPFDKMEFAIHEAYARASENDLRSAFTMSHEYPLSGFPPMMTHVFKHDYLEPVIACKGGVEGILKQSNLPELDKMTVLKQAIEFAKSGYRVLGVAKANHDINSLPESQHDFEFIFLGLIAFYDPPKKNIKEVLQKFYDAGIKVKMITGDYAETAQSIAGEISFINDSQVLNGSEIMQMSSEELTLKVEQVDIFARMFPEAKLRVIEALKANGEVVAMTGDGVNDGPALKAAHIGIAMGLRGSELAKKASALVLLDDDLIHMVDAVALGRRIYENLKKAIQYIISIHIPIILIVTLPLLFFWKYVNLFSPVHVIFLELIMGPTCSIIFENEPIEPGSMNRLPRRMSSSFFSFHELSLSIIQGLVITCVCLGLGYYYMQQNATEAEVRTIIYSTLIFCNIFLTLVNRSFYHSVFATLKYKNAMIPIVLLVSLLVLLLSIYVEPVRAIFNFVELEKSDLLLCLGLAIPGVFWVELLKFRKRKIANQNNLKV